MLFQCGWISWIFIYRECDRIVRHFISLTSIQFIACVILGNLSNWFSGVQIPPDICTCFGLVRSCTDKGSKDCLEDLRFRHWEEFEVATLVFGRDMHTINLTFKCLKGSPPMFFKDYFKVFRTIHNTRGSGKNLMLPKVRTETARKSFYFN